MSELPHGGLERLLHRLAFAALPSQRGLADLETRRVRRELDRLRLGPPVYVVGLPRGGTTMLHHVLASLPEFAGHTYRDLPFVLCPLAWTAASARFRRQANAAERAHGDGIVVSLDSPAALDEVCWRAHFGDVRRGRGEPPWGSPAAAAFATAYAEHRGKVVLRQARRDPRAARYLAKNNQLLARLPQLWTVVPDAVVVAPFRSPWAQAWSLLRQHRRFLERHAADPFARRFMADLGHCEFGLDQRPLLTPATLPGMSIDDPRQLGHWLGQWLAAHRHLLALAADPRLVLVDFERLAATRDGTALATRLGVPATALAAAATMLVDVARPAPAPDDLPAAAAAMLQQVCTELRRHAVP